MALSCMFQPLGLSGRHNAGTALFKVLIQKYCVVSQSMTYPVPGTDSNPGLVLMW